jgi:uncharacterized protein YndB with AHSA1/START domain
MNIDELSRIDRQIEIAAPIDRVWRALTNPAELSAWFQVTIEGEIAAGKEVQMTTTHLAKNQQSFRVLFVELDAPRKFVWQWHPGMKDPQVDYSKEPRTTVTFTLEQHGRGTRVSVAETGFDAISLDRRAKVHQDNSGGWSTVLVWLKNFAEKDYAEA